ncbi:hypothetical protein K1720_06630 [Thermococcus argininiproducens]|uniref:Uncharacterized protein n=1 Tax=Thermococcus argininiproducens TaxID=2866384 RepID=A0A9E7M8T4_9EURY|nr:hypothetical protein [Thermococcus argininiproducens]USG99218.1 hypothetical protein K1720_06630 [Thermococcus argininiproducens]
MKYSKLAVKILEYEEREIYYDPVYHGRSLKIFGIDDDPTKVIEYIGDRFFEKEYGLVFFDTRGKYSKEKFDTIVKIEDNKPTGLDPIKMAKEGILKDFYTAATIIQTIYGLDRSLTDKLYSDILTGKIKSVPEAAVSKEKYGEVIRETYTTLDEVFFKGKPPELGKSVLIDFGNAYSITLVGMAFLILAAAVKDRRNTLIGIDDAAVLFYTTPGSAAIPLLTQPMRGRVTLLASRYVAENLLNAPGPTLILYNDPDLQSMIYEANGVPQGAMRKHVLKGEGAFVWRTTQTLEVEFGKLSI